VTVDPKFSIAQAVAIRDGKFAAVGSDSEIKALAGSKTEVVDLGGKTVLPGFTDRHGHVSITWGKVVDSIEAKYRVAKSVDEIVDLVREKHKALPPDQLLFFDRGPTSTERLKEKRWPNRDDLDKVSKDRLILLAMGGAGSNLVVNSAVLRKVGLSRNVPQPT